MTLPNSFTSTTRKFEKIWKNVNDNAFSIDIQKSQQSVIVNQLDRSKVRNWKNNRITDLSEDWCDMEIGQLYEYSMGGVENIVTQEIYKSWKVEVIGLKASQLSSMQHKYLFKFGEDGEILQNIQDTTTVITSDYVLPLSSDDSNKTFTFYYGVHLSEFGYSHIGLPEIDKYAIKVKLKLDLFNPNRYV